MGAVSDQLLADAIRADVAQLQACLIEAKRRGISVRIRVGKGFGADRLEFLIDESERLRTELIYKTTKETL